MKLSPFLLLLALALHAPLRSQNDSVLCNESFRVKEGVYLSYDHFRKQDPIAREHIESGVDKEHLDFFGKTMSGNKLNYSQGGEKIVTDTKNVWGFYQNNTLHVNFRGEFFRVPVFGSICYLVATVEVVNPAFYTPGYGIMSGPTQSKELRNFLMNFYDGVIQPFSMNEAEKLLSRDEKLYAEYKSLKSRQRKEQVSRYIRKFNEQNPVYFLK